MASPENTVWLKVNGVDYGGWKSVSITSGLDRQARDFELGITRRWPGQSDVPRAVAPGDSCQVLIGSDLVLTGFVDATPIRYDHASLSVGVRGRSATADLVDCAAINEPGQWSGRRLAEIIRDLAAPYSVAVVADAVTTDVVATHQIDQGETVFESIDRLISTRALLSTDDAQGRLVLTRAGTLKATTALVHGDNILDCDAPLDFKDRYSRYVVKGQSIGDDASFGGAVSVLAEASDPGVKRRRVMMKKQTGDATAQYARLEARWEAASRSGKSYKTTYTVQGWRQADGALWLPNMLVHVRDPVVGYDTDMLIGEVTYSLDDQGTRCRLTVAPPGAWDLKPDAAKEKKSGGKSGGVLTKPGETLVEF